MQQRLLFQKPSLEQQIKYGEPVAKAATHLDIEEVLTSAHRINKIAHVAAKMSGIAVGRPGDYDAQRLVWAAYISADDIVRGMLAQGYTPDDTRERLLSDQTHHTLIDLAHRMNGPAFAELTKSFRTMGGYLTVTDEGIALDSSVHIANSMLGKGCPYAHGNPVKAQAFTALADTAHETYIQAHERGMPVGWLAMVSRSLRRTSAPAPVLPPTDSHR